MQTSEMVEMAQNIYFRPGLRSKTIFLVDGGNEYYYDDDDVK